MSNLLRTHGKLGPILGQHGTVVVNGGGVGTILVLGSSLGILNGIYTDTGTTHEGKPVYEKASDDPEWPFWIAWDCAGTSADKWVIGKGDQDGIHQPYHYSDEDVATPDLVEEGWDDDAATGPITVTAGGEGYEGDFFAFTTLAESEVAILEEDAGAGDSLAGATLPAGITLHGRFTKIALVSGLARLYMP